jgi:hypothetical protein
MRGYAGAADPTLIADITGFIDNAENGVYADGYGFDRDGCRVCIVLLIQ